MRYQRLLEATNSVSQLHEFVAATFACWERRVPFGTYNVTNPGRGDHPRGRGAHPAQRRLRQGVLLFQRRGRIHAAWRPRPPAPIASWIRASSPARASVLTEVHAAIESALRQWQRRVNVPAPMNVLVTGGCGFIGSNFIRQRLAESGGPLGRLVNLDKLTYAGNPANLADLAGDPRYVFVQGDIGDEALVSRLLADHAIDAVVNFAAESHVDRSIDSPRAVHPDQRRRHAPPAATPPGAIGRSWPEPGTRGVPLPACVDRRGLRDPRPGRSGLHRGNPVRAQQPVRRVEGRQRPPGAGLPPHLPAAHADDQLLEQLRSLPFSGEADPPGDPQRPRRQAAAGLRRRPADPRLALRRGSRRARSGWSCSAAGSARPTISAA